MCRAAELGARLFGSQVFVRPLVLHQVQSHLKLVRLTPLSLQRHHGVLNDGLQLTMDDLRGLQAQQETQNLPLSPSAAAALVL